VKPQPFERALAGCGELFQEAAVDWAGYSIVRARPNALIDKALDTTDVDHLYLSDGGEHAGPSEQQVVPELVHRVERGPRRPSPLTDGLTVVDDLLIAFCRCALRRER
jgi:hypothetical protein